MHQASLAHFYYLHQLYLRVLYVLKNEKKHQMISQNENACSEKMLLKLSFLSFINKVSTVRMIIIYSKNSILITDKSWDSDLTLSFFLILTFEEDFFSLFFFDYDFFRISMISLTSLISSSRQARQSIILYNTELK